MQSAFQVRMVTTYMGVIGHSYNVVGIIIKLIKIYVVAVLATAGAIDVLM
jgi:hypothetical protein